LLATNSIGMGTNLTVMKRIKDTGDIFMAWSDREWTLDGAAVRVAMIGFDNGEQDTRVLDGLPVETINPDLTATVDITEAVPLGENQNIAFIGTQKSGPFDISFSKAQSMINANNSSGLSNADVIVPWVNGADIVRRSRGMYIIDFPVEMTEEEASKYEEPFKYVQDNVRPKRTAKHFEGYPYWIHWNTRPAMREAMIGKVRYLITSRVSKYRVFAWMNIRTNPDSATVAIVRDDDYFFGVLHSKLHELWSLRMGTSLGPTPRYTPTTTFETFPFPWPPGKENQPSAAYQAVSRAAKQLNAERHIWLNPAGVAGKALKERTLTNLYNALQVFRGRDSIKVKAAAADFAPRLHDLHQALDVAVCAAYGWEPAILDDDEEILRRLLELNLARG